MQGQKARGVIEDRIKERRASAPKAGAPEAASVTPKAGPGENENHSHGPDNENHSHLNENENHSHLGNFYPRRNTTLIYFFLFFSA